MSNNIQLKMKVKTLKIEQILDKVYHLNLGVGVLQLISDYLYKAD